MHEGYRNFFLSRVQAAVAAARAATGVSHKGVRGEIREVLMRDLFRPLLPADVGVGTGEIISATGQTSTQQDVVLYDRRILPPVLFEESLGLFPVESVLYTIEIKSRLDAEQLQAAHDAATALLQLDYAPGGYDPAGNAAEHDFTPVIGTVLALDTDLVADGKRETERYDEIRGEAKPSLRVLCVVGRGYWFWHNGAWQPWDAHYDLEEVVAFVAGVMNTYRQVARSRREPRLGRYLIDEGAA